MPYDEIIRCSGSLTLKSADSDEFTEYVFGQGRPSLEDIVAALSRDNTLKTGDILLLGLAGEGPEVAPGLRATLRLNGEETLGFNIR